MKNKRNSFQVLLDLIGLVKPLLGYMILAITLGVIGHLCATFISVNAAQSIVLIFNKQFQGLYLIMISMLVFAVARGLLRYGEQTCNHFIAFKLLAHIRLTVFEKLKTLAPSKLDGKDKGNLISMITSDIELLEVFYAHTISPFFIYVIFSLILIGYIASIHVIFAIIALCAYIWVGIILPLIINKKYANSSSIYRDKNGELASIVLENTHGIFEIVQTNSQNMRKTLLMNKTDELINVEDQMKRIGALNSGIISASILIWDLLIVLIGAYLINHQLLEPIKLVSVFFMLVSSFGPSVALANLGSTLQNTIAAGKRVLDLLDETPVVDEVNNKPVSEYGTIQVNDVSFSYDSNLILDNVNFEFKPNTSYGLQASSGFGKSTLLKLIMRFYDPNKGIISINNKDIKEINTHDLRSMQAYMTQDTYIFSASIKDNITLANPNISMQQIQQVVKACALEDYIESLPNGYDTMVGSGNIQLSAGEKQRIGLARALIANANVLLLDEPTSNLDSLNEALILKSIKQFCNDKTIVMVSHRPSSLRLMDEVIQLDAA